MKAIPVLAIVLAAAWLPAADPTNVSAVASAARAADGDTVVTAALEPIRRKHGLPALAGAVVTSQGLRQHGVVGVRKAGTTVAATTNDEWHLGSDTKAMTAALAGKLVEAKVLKWDTSVAEVFPELANTFHQDMSGVTLLHLLSHRASLPANLNWGAIARKGTVRQQRVRSISEAFAKKPASKPGEKYTYSNLGYVVAGAMLERLTGTAWEDLLRENIFKPLRMDAAGFGGTGTPGQLDQPWGHTASAKPVSGNGQEMDNLPVIWPGGGVHATVQDWARFIADQLHGGRGESGLLQASTYRRLHSPPFDGDYALGWAVAKRDWGGTVLNHDGCNTMNYAVAWLAPAKDFAVLVCCNQGDNVAAKACDEAAGALIKIATRK